MHLDIISAEKKNNFVITDLVRAPDQRSA